MKYQLPNFLEPGTVTAICLAFLAVFLIGHNRGNCLENLAEEIPGNDRYEEELRRKYVDVEVFGAVTDRSGSRIEGCSIHLTVTRIGADTPIEIGPLDCSQPSGYSESLKGIRTLSMAVEAEGYYTVRWSWSSGEMSPEPLKAARISDEPVRLLRKVVMDRIPTDAGRMRRLAFELTSEVTENPSSSCVGFRSPRGEAYLLPNLVAALPSSRGSCSRFSLAFVDSQEPATVFVKPANSSHYQAAERFLVLLEEPGDQGGFIPYVPDGGGSDEISTLRGMSTAPTSGYVRQLEVRADERSRKAFFYCQLQGRYCKGVIDRNLYLDCDTGNCAINAGIVIWINEIGTADVSAFH